MLSPEDKEGDYQGKVSRVLEGFGVVTCIGLLVLLSLSLYTGVA